MTADPRDIDAARRMLCGTYDLDEFLRLSRVEQISTSIAEMVGQAREQATADERARAAIAMLPPWGAPLRPTRQRHDDGPPDEALCKGCGKPVPGRLCLVCGCEKWWHDGGVSVCTYKGGACACVSFVDGATNTLAESMHAHCTPKEPEPAVRAGQLVVVVEAAKLDDLRTRIAALEEEVRLHVRAIDAQADRIAAMEQRVRAVTDRLVALEHGDALNVKKEPF